MANVVEIPNWLKNLPLAPEFRPTDTEFADPIAYISKIEKEATPFGICKVIPPLPKPSKRYVLTNLNRSFFRSSELDSDANVIPEAKAVFTTRQQELGLASKRNSRDIGGCMPHQPTAQKQVWQSGEVYTLEQFEAKSKAFSRSVLGGIREVTPQVIESLFWKANSEKPIYVEYANDVPGSGFGEPEGLVNYFHGRKRKRRRKQYEQKSHLGRPSCGFEALGQGSYSVSDRGEELTDEPTSSSNETLLSSKRNVSHDAGELEGTAGWKLSNSPWNLQVIARSAGSLTRFLLDDIPGVTSPMVYIGMLFSWFAWHVEDHELHSLNFHHMGAPKTWYAVPGDYASAFEEIIRKEAYGENTDHLAALKRIGEKTTLLSPELVVSSGIPCCRLVQNPGEFVVTFPRAYHVGFSHGFNCGEAANFGTPQWLTVAKDAAIRRAAMDHLPMLSHQQLLYLLTMSFIPRIPRSLLPSIRSSRLKDRLKEERELLVKRAFIKDVLKENRLLYILSDKYPAFRAVLWHPDLLPALVKESLPETRTTLHSILDKDNEASVTAIKDSNHDGRVQQLITSNVETVIDSCNNDLSCDFQVDSGALQCVTCGILGYPLMSVIQPSMKAAADLFPAEHLLLTEEAESCKKAKSSHLAHLTEQAISVTNVDETWHTHGVMRPRIFCLEHAIQVEDLLRPKGGAKMLVVCHSDYEKIRINAATVAEEIRTQFKYKEVVLDSASKEELSLIDAAIDGEQSNDCQGDWTSKLGMNLRYSVKVRTGCHPKKIGDLNSDYLLSLISPGSMISNIKWCSRKSRTRRESNNKKQIKSCSDNHSQKDESICEQGSNVKKREKVLLHYSRRKHRARSKDLGAKCASTYGVDCSIEVPNANCEKIDACERKITGCTFARVMCLDSTELHALDPTEHNTLQHGADEVIGGSVLGKACTNLEVDDHGTSKMSKILCENERQKHAISPGIDSTISIEVTMPTFQKENCSDSCQISPPACSLQVNDKEDMDRTIEDVEASFLKTRKRVKQIAQDEVYNEFVRSPCEGLRPRKRKEGSNTSSLTEQKLASKMTRKSLRSSISDNKVKGGEGPYKCNLEGCHMCFRKKAEMLLHKHNKCHYEGCRKKFRSHRYLVLHQRVHDDKRPLKCTWKGCGMTFKWVWARTEHMRLHTGERPYQCKTKGCGRTFRFVSDFSRHRRKMGHYINPVS